MFVVLPSKKHFRGVTLCPKACTCLALFAVPLFRKEVIEAKSSGPVSAVCGTRGRAPWLRGHLPASSLCPPSLGEHSLKSDFYVHLDGFYKDLVFKAAPHSPDSAGMHWDVGREPQLREEE